jgi:hypothetical protein
MAIIELSNAEVSVVSGGSITESLATIFGNMLAKYQDAVLPQIEVFMVAFMKALFSTNTTA